MATYIKQLFYCGFQYNKAYDYFADMGIKMAMILFWLSILAYVRSCHDRSAIANPIR